MANLASSLACAIQHFEGWAPGSVSYRNNNPGNLRSGPGMIGTDAGGYAVFPDYQTGWNALLNQVQINVNRGLTLDEFFAGKPDVYPGYAPAADSNRLHQYAVTAAGWIGIDPSVPLNQISVPAGEGPIADIGGSAASASTLSILDQFGPSLSNTDPVSPDPTFLVIGTAMVIGVVVLILNG
jgi:hypothetical protein